MVDGCCMKCIKHTVLFGNIAFLILGSIAVGFGLYFILGDKLDADLRIYFLIFAGAGGITCLLGFLGCFGAVFENKCLLGSYLTMCLLFCLAEAGISMILLIGFRDEKGKQMHGNRSQEMVTKVAFSFIGLSALHLLGLIFSMVLCCNIKDNQPPRLHTRDTTPSVHCTPLNPNALENAEKNANRTNRDRMVLGRNIGRHHRHPVENEVSSMRINRRTSYLRAHLSSPLNPIALENIEKDTINTNPDVLVLSRNNRNEHRYPVEMENDQSLRLNKYDSYSPVYFSSPLNPNTLENKYDEMDTMNTNRDDTCGRSSIYDNLSDDPVRTLN